MVFRMSFPLLILVNVWFYQRMYNNRLIGWQMNTKKIIRLSSPGKQKENLRTPESTFANTRFFQLQQTIEVKNIESSESLQVTLINEINKIYKETQSIKKELEKQQQLNTQLVKERKVLKAQVRILERQCQTYKEMYQLQCSNHQRLRDFYERREEQWQVIVLSHKQMLQQYDMKHGSSFIKAQHHKNGELGLMSKQNTHQNNIQQSDHQAQQRQANKESRKKQIKRLKRRPQTENKNAQIHEDSHKAAYYIAQINRLYTQQKQFAEKSELYEDHQHKAAKRLNKNPQSDDIFERILRKTYYHFRGKCLSINQIRQCEDMIKLKHAKTSTKQRLIKTLKKLQFQVDSEGQLQQFCEYVEELILHQQRMFRGDLVFNFLLDKLHECEEMAQRSNSEIQKFGLSIVKAQKDVGNQYKDIQKIGKQNLELLLNSAIKKPPPIESSDIQNKIRYSISSLQNLSDLIHGDTMS